MYILCIDTNNPGLQRLKTMTPREERGLILAARSRGIKRKGNLWNVPSSQVNHHSYLVNLSAKTCTCLDHQEGGHKCKHIYAAEIVYQREFEFNSDGTVTEVETITTVQQVRKTYPQDWRGYNAAQVNEKSQFQVLLRGLCDGINVPKQLGPGCRRVPLDDAIFSAVFKVYSTVSGRRFMSDMNDARAKGHVDRMPSYNTIFRVLESEETTAVLESLIAESANPLKAFETKFAVDSSGFSSSRFDRWFDHKWGDIRSVRIWTKAHIMVGVTTNVITACEVSNAGDCPTLPKLLNATTPRFNVTEVSADLAYSSAANLEAINAVGASPLIPFKSNATGSDRHGSLWTKMFHYFNYKRDEFMAKYHNRSNVESTFSMLKAKFGDSVRSRTDTAMRNEVLAKILCHNIVVLISAMYELGVAPIFWNEQTSIVGQN
jgi:transposase